jgi:hypothetical protein
MINSYVRAQKEMLNLRVCIARSRELLPEVWDGG